MQQFKSFKIRVLIGEVLDTLIANKAKHAIDYAKGHEAWREAVVRKMKENLSLAVSKGEFKLAIRMPEPASYARDYDQIISLLKMAAKAGEEVFELETSQHRAWVMDEWDWSSSFTATNSSYLGG